MAYTDKQKTEIVNRACEAIAQGEPIREILKGDDMPSSSTFFSWIEEDIEKAKQYARVLNVRAHLKFDEIDDIVNEDCSYTITDEQGNTVTRVDTGKIQHQRLKYDAVKWKIGKMNPKKYGDKIEQEITGKGINIIVNSKEELNDLNSIGKDL